jgi:hypothetical protein
MGYTRALRVIMQKKGNGFAKIKTVPVKKTSPRKKKRSPRKKEESSQKKKTSTKRIVKGIVKL